MSEFYKWDPSFLTVKVAEMDAEHEILIKKMNKLFEYHALKKSPAELKAVLTDFMNYTIKHFTDEEAYMAKIKFEGLDIHKAIHASLLKQATEYAQEFERTGKLTDAFFKFLSVWLTSHIRGIDRKYAA